MRTYRTPPPSLQSSLGLALHDRAECVPTCAAPSPHMALRSLLQSPGVVPLPHACMPREGLLAACCSSRLVAGNVASDGALRVQADALLLCCCRRRRCCCSAEWAQGGSACPQLPGPGPGQRGASGRAHPVPRGGGRGGGGAGNPHGPAGSHGQGRRRQPGALTCAGAGRQAGRQAHRRRVPPVRHGAWGAREVHRWTGWVHDCTREPRAAGAALVVAAALDTRGAGKRGVDSAPLGVWPTTTPAHLVGTAALSIPPPWTCCTLLLRIMCSHNTHTHAPGRCMARR